jgi:hypothetical protein
MQQTMVEPHAPGRPVHFALGLGMRAALISDPIGLVFIPLVFRFPNVALEALQAGYLGALDPGRLEQPLIAFAMFVGWGFALVGLTLSQALLIRRTASWMRSGTAAPLEREFEAIFASFPTFLAVSLLFWGMLFLGMFLLLLPGIAVLFFYGFAPQAAVLERVGLFESFRRSRRLVRGHFGRWVVGVLMIAGGVLASVVGLRLIWLGVHEALGGDVPFGLWVVAFFVIELVSVLFTVSWTAMYVDLTQQYESLTDSMLPEAREAAGLEFAPSADDEVERTRWQAG